MTSKQISDHLLVYRENQQIIDAAKFVLREFGLESNGLAGFEYREDQYPNFIVITTEGNIGERQTIKLPRNFFDFDFSLALNLLAHEMLHVRQKTVAPFVEDKNEREWQAYTENLFHTVFSQIPDAPLFNQRQFAEKALEYYRRMGEGSNLQRKYDKEKQAVEQRLNEILKQRGESKELTGY